jgi:hypothetical protein
MKAFQLNALRNAIESLTDSTYLRLEAEGVKCEIEGRCSPHISHKTITFSATGKQNYAMVLATHRQAIALGGGEAFDLTELVPGEYEQDVVSEFAPYALVRGLLAKIQDDCGLTFQAGTLVRVSWTVQRLAFFDEKRKPVFVRRPEIARQTDAVTEEDETEDAFVESV